MSIAKGGMSLIKLYLFTLLRRELMDKAQHNERPTDIVLTGTLREEAKRASLRRNSDKNFGLMRNPI